MIRRLIAAKSRNDFAKGEVVLYRDWGGFLIEDSYYSSNRQMKVRRAPDDFVLLELDKFNAIVSAHSMGEIRREAKEQVGDADPNNPGYRFVTDCDI